MSWDGLERRWNQARGKFKKKWSPEGAGDLEMIARTRERLVAQLQERYGVAKEEAEKHADEFVSFLGRELQAQKRAAGDR
jgi:uncharacterized protein YjbJ (UPF0337 family)